MISDEPLWTLDQVIRLARFMEPILFKVSHHCAVAGGCLHGGESDKDADIIIYPRKKPSKFTIGSVIDKLSKHGFSDWVKCDHLNGYKDYPDTKIVWTCKFSGKRVDVFFLS